MAISSTGCARSIETGDSHGPNGPRNDTAVGQPGAAVVVRFRAVNNRPYDMVRTKPLSPGEGLWMRKNPGVQKAHPGLVVEISLRS